MTVVVNCWYDPQCIVPWPSCSWPTAERRVGVGCARSLVAPGSDASVIPLGTWQDDYFAMDTVRPELETLRPWQAWLGIPVGLLYMAGNALEAAGLPTVPGPVLYAAALIILISIAPTAWRGLKRLRWRALMLMGIGLGLVFAFQGILWPTILQNLGVPLDNTNTQQVAKWVQTSPVLMGVLVIVVGPVVEEVLYRFAIFRTLHHLNPVLGHVVTSLLFGLQHIAVAVFVNGNAVELWQLPGYVFFSLVMSVLYIRSGTLLVPVGVHMASNALGFLTLLA